MITLTAEKKYSFNFTVTREKFYLSLHYNGANCHLFINGTKIIKFKANNTEINAIPLCLGSISKYFLVDTMKQTGFYGHVYDFSVDYDAIVNDDLLDIPKYLMEKIIYMQSYSINNVCVYLKKITAMTFFSCCALNPISLKCVPMYNQGCKIRPEILNNNSNDSSFYPACILVNKFSGSCNNVNDPYAKLCIPNVIKA